MTASGRLFHWGKTNPFNTKAWPQRLYPWSSGKGDAGPETKKRKNDKNASDGIPDRSEGGLRGISVRDYYWEFVNWFVIILFVRVLLKIRIFTAKEVEIK